MSFLRRAVHPSSTLQTPTCPRARLCESFSIRVQAVARGSDTNTEQPSVLQILSQRGQGRRQKMIRLRTSPGFMVKGIPRMMIMIHAIECRNRDRTLKDALVRATLQQKSDACLARDKSLQLSSRQSPQYLRAPLTFWGLNKPIIIQKVSLFWAKVLAP